MALGEQPIVLEPVVRDQALLMAIGNEDSGIHRPSLLSSGQPCIASRRGSAAGISIGIVLPEAQSRGFASNWCWCSEVITFHPARDENCVKDSELCPVEVTMV